MKLAIVTGGSRGLGEALCSKFMDLGYRVVEFSRGGNTSNNVKIDFANPDQAHKILVETFSKGSENEYEEIVAINNAATLSPIGPTAKKSPVEIKANININFISQILFVANFIKYFQQYPCKKTIVNISSGAALKGYSGWSLYCAAKAGIDNYFRCIAIEQSNEIFPINAFSVDPAIMDTDMQKLIRRTPLKDFPYHDRFMGYKENGQLKSPTEVADYIVQLIANSPPAGSRFSVLDKTPK